jgi:hypothetical protein
MRSWVQVLETAFCRNAGKGCVHETQCGRTLHKRELRAPGCLFDCIAESTLSELSLDIFADLMVKHMLEV